MSYFSEDFIKFFKQLEKNNNREWFKKNKERYINSVKNPFENFMQEMLHRIYEDDEEINLVPKESIFRIYRDVRFSKDKKPYKTFASAIISPGGRKELTSPGYYFEFNAKEIRFYGGAHFLQKEQLQKVRESIAANTDEFYSLIADKEFKKRFGKILGEQNKRIPKEFKEIIQVQPLIANKQFYFFNSLESSKILNSRLPDILMKYYYAGKPMIMFLREAMK